MQFNDFKPLLSVLVMPPVLGLLVAGVGWWMARRWQAPRHGLRRRLARAIFFSGLAGVWLGSCQATALWLQDHVLHPPAALTAAGIAELRAEAQRDGPQALAVVVLGGGRQRLAAEYDEPMLTELPLARLHYGIWLARATGVALAYSGGVGWAEQGGPSEARTAQRVAARDYYMEMRWLEEASRDTRENASFSTELLLQAGVKHLVVVTHASHMPRALRAFTQAAQGRLQITAAPMGFVTLDERLPLPWLPTGRGMAAVHAAWHEVIGLMLGR
ncbi:MAG: hypothetical protein RIQ60_2660 [Pseudomonadota bacterium]|jgi:uncharacterized SAM-binding protein YcdF (DUF218 family)